MVIPQVTPMELATELEGADRPIVLDVREHDELAISQIEGSIHIPMGEVPARIGELDPAANYVIQCRSGGRSQQVAEYLASHGFSRVRNLAGGINLWAAEVDPTLPTY